MAAKVKTQQYRLLVDRRIGGKRCVKGQIVELGDETAHFLMASGAIELVAENAVADATQTNTHQG